MHIKRVGVVLAVVAAAGFLSFGWPKRNGLDIGLNVSKRAQAARIDSTYDLTQLEVLNNVVREVKDHYVDPKRIDFQRMLLSGLDAIQRNVAPVLVHYEEGQARFRIQVHSDSAQFSVDDLDGPWALAHRFREVFAFLQTRLKDEPELELRDVEYAAVNGMLDTLDPHSVLLTPDVFEEMQMSTRGEFGGLGIVISIRDGHLTIIRPIDGTPASKAGLKRRDRIVQINDESTLNMPLSEAVDRLRGRPGSKVSVWIQRQNKVGSWAPKRRVQLTRAIIHIDSVTHRMLKGGVGYIEINNFQGNTHADLKSALKSLHQRRMRALILDLRGNPGGLLSQAIRVSDTFLRGGPIVSTSSRDPRQREDKVAREAGTEPDYPMVVLLNSGSASASEIVAGALKNHDRALIVGEQSFGKGSVQVLYDMHDGSALKLTVAQYLTPGDVSIQGVGIVPDIAVRAMTADPEDMDLQVDDAYLREEDLRAHLVHESAELAEKPSVKLGYFLDRDLRQRLREAEPNEEENEAEETFLIRFSRELLSRSKTSSRPAMLERAQPVAAQIQAQENKRIARELSKLGVDWAVGKDQGPSEVRVELSTDAKDNIGVAGASFSLRAKVTNLGKAPLYQLHATTASDFRLFNARELVFGRLNPGETRTWSTTLGVCKTEEQERKCRLPRDLLERADGVRVNFSEAHGHAPAPTEIRVGVRALPKPEFAYSYQVADNLLGNGDAKLQRGERVTVYLKVKNVGKGTAFKTQANLRNVSGRGVLLQDGRFELGELKPGEERSVPFTFQLLSDGKYKEAKLELVIGDSEQRVYVRRKLTLPVSATGSSPHPLEGSVIALNGSVVRAAPSLRAGVVARVRGTVALEQSAELDGFTRVELGEGRPGWIATASLSEGRGEGSLEYVVTERPPRLEVSLGGKLATRGTQIDLSGQALDERRIRDVSVFAGSRKVFYGSNDRAADRGRLNFATKVPLHPGINYITVVARENDESVARRIFVVRRDAPDGSLMETPKHDQEPFGLAANGGM